MHTSFDPTPREAVLFGRPEEYARAWTLAHPVTAAQRQAGRPVRAGPQDRTHPGEARHPQPSPLPRPAGQHPGTNSPPTQEQAGGRLGAGAGGRWGGCCDARGHAANKPTPTATAVAIRAHFDGWGSHGLDNLWTESSTALWVMDAMVTWAFESAGSAGALFALVCA